MTEFISEIKAAWLGNRQRRFHQNTRGIMTPEDRQVLEQEFDRELAAHDAEVAAKALTEAAEGVVARWEDTGLGAVGASWLRARAAEYRKAVRDE